MKHAALALLLLGQEVVGVNVSVQTRDGQTLAGVVQPMTVDFQSSLGKSSIKLEDLSAIGIGEKEHMVSTSDGTTLRGTLLTESIKVKTKLGEMTIKFADILSLNVTGVQRGQPKLDSNPNPVPGPRPADPKKPEPQGQKPVATLKIGAMVTRMIPSSDGKKFYLLNASDSKVVVVNAETLAADKEIALSGGETAMDLGPSGKVLLACGKKTVSSVSIDDGKMTKTFPIENDAFEIAAIDDQTALVATNNGLVTVSVPKQSIVSKLGQGGGTDRMHVFRDARKIYAGGGAVLLPDKAKKRDELVWSPFASGQGPGWCTFSPDGRFAASSSGIIFRTGKSFIADMVQLAKVDPHWSSAWDAGRQRLMIFLPNGFVKEYDIETFEIARTFQLGFKVLEAFVAADGASFTAVGAPASGGDTSGRPYRQQMTADLLKFEMPK